MTYDSSDASRSLASGGGRPRPTSARGAVGGANGLGASRRGAGAAQRFSEGTGGAKRGPASTGEEWLADGILFMPADPNSCGALQAQTRISSPFVSDKEEWTNLAARARLSAAGAEGGGGGGTGRAPPG